MINGKDTENKKPEHGNVGNTYSMKYSEKLNDIVRLRISSKDKGILTHNAQQKNLSLSEYVLRILKREINS